MGEQGDVYHCPVDEGPYEDRSKPIYVMTSYLANGALNGFGSRGMEQYKLSQFRPDSTIFWENDDKAGLGSWHDGANDRRQSLTTRHDDGAPVSLIDGSTTKWTKTSYDSLYRERKANSLWCAPGSSNGRR